MNLPIYLDYAATTPIDHRVAQKMQDCLIGTNLFGNSASQHAYGEIAREAIETARAQVAALIHADPSEIIWTSGATESDNLALKGSAHLYQRQGKHIVTMKTEHKAVLDTCQHLAKEGYVVTYLAPQANGLLDLEEFSQSLRPDTILVSIMLVNNETGVLQDINAIAQITAARGILLHVDAAQAAGKVAIDVRHTPIDLLSLSAHKIYGPKGVGALYLRKKPRVRIAPLFHGGGHEQGMRSGTLATHQAVGMGEACCLAAEDWERDTLAIRHLRDCFLSELQNIEQLRVNLDLNHCVPHILNLQFKGMLATALLSMLPQIAASQASACQGKGAEGSYILRAMGFSDAQVKSSIRFSLGRFTTLSEVKTASQAISHLFTDDSSRQIASRF